MNESLYAGQLHSLYRQCMRQGGEFEKEAERHRLEAERAYEDAGKMKAEGRRRAGITAGRMLPNSERGVDVHTGAFKDMQDAKGDFVLFMTLANTYANMATMKFAKAAAVLAEYETHL